MAIFLKKSGIASLQTGIAWPEIGMNEIKRGR
jgi:hypothetical protein